MAHNDSGLQVKTQVRMLPLGFPSSRRRRRFVRSHDTGFYKDESGKRKEEEEEDKSRLYDYYC